MNRSADELTTREFSIVRKGYDTGEVRAYLALLARELAPPWSAGEESAGPDTGSAPGANDPELADEIARLREERDGLVASLDRLRRDHVQELAVRTSEGEARVAAVEAQAANGPWRGAGEAVERVLAAAHEEAAGLIETAEVVATGIRRELQAELAGRRAEADREAAAVRGDADRHAVERRAAVDAELARAAAAVEEGRAEAERLRSDAEAQVAQAQVELERTRAVQAETAARLQRVQGLVRKALDAAEEQPRPGADGAAAPNRAVDARLDPTTVLPRDLVIRPGAVEPPAGLDRVSPPVA